MIVTSYYARAEALKLLGYTCVSVSNSQPKGLQFPTLSLVVPPWSLVDSYKKGTITWEEYERQYTEKVLSKLNPDSLLADIKMMFGDNIALFCWEKGNCHRRILGKWLGVEEYIPEVV